MAPVADEERTFWQALEAAPQDEHLRCVFADWLDDRGDPRGPWIRDSLVFPWMRAGEASPVPRLLEILEEGSVHEVGDALSRVGAAAVRPLLDILGDESRNYYAAASALNRMEATALEPFVSELIALLPTRGTLLVEIFEQLGPLGASAVQALMDAEAKRQIRGKEFVQALSQVGLAAAPAVPRVVELLYRGDAKPEHVTKILSAVGPESAAPLLQQAAATDLEGVHRAAELTDLGPAVRPWLTAALADPQPQVRYVAALALAQWCEAASLPVLLEALESPNQNEGFRNDVVRAIGRIGPDAAESLPILRRLLGDAAEPHPHTGEITEALLAVDGWHGRVIGELAIHPCRDVRERTFRALMHAPLGPFRSLMLLVLKDPDSEIRSRYAGFLAGRLGSVKHDIFGRFRPEPEDAETLECFRPLLTDPDPYTRSAGLSGLHIIRSAAEPALAEILAATRDPEAMVRRVAAVVLDDMGVEKPEMLGALLVLLDDPDEEVRHAAAEGLSKWTAMFPEHHDAVLRRLNDPDPVVRWGAVRLTGQARESTPELIELHRTILRTAGNYSLRTAAAGGLARLRANAPEVIADLLAYLDESQAKEAATALVELGALAPLAERLATQPALRRVILGALNGLEREQAAELPVKGVIACLDDEDSLHRQWALQILERVGLRAAGAVFRVRQLLDDPGYFVRAYAAQALGRISPQPAAVLPDLIRVLGDNEGFVRGFAASALGGLAIPPMEKFSVIRPFLGDPDSHVRRNAARVIGQAGPDAAAAVPELIALFADEDKWVRSAAAVALGQVGETAASACAALTALLTDPEGLPRDDAAQALGKLGPTARTAVPALLRVLAEDPELYVRASAAKTIVGLGAADQTGEGVARLRELLHDPNAVRRGGAAEILGALGPAARPAVPDLLAVLRDPVWGEAHADVRKDNISDNFQFCSDEELERRSHDRRTLVAAALGAIGAEPGVVKALGVAADDPDEQVGQAAVSALGKLRPAADAVLGGLHHHARESIRRSAAEALHPEHIPFRDPKV